MRLSITRRQFLRRSAQTAGVLAVAPVLGNTATLAAEKAANPFAYDVGRLARTDPRLIRYEQTGGFAGPANEPRRLAVGADGRVYIACRSGISIHEHDGARVDELALPTPARCVAVAEDGAVYAGVRDHIEVFDRKGQRLAAWESPGKKAWLTGLAVSGNDVFAADSGSRVVLHYERSGKLAGRIGEKNKERNIAGLIIPSPYLDVELGRDGLLRVNNPGRHCVETYTTNGELELSWGKPSAAIEGFCGCCNPIALAQLPDGRIITCEKGLPRVKVFAPDGTFDCVVAGPESFPENSKAGSAHDASDGTMGGLDAAVDSRGRIYVLDLKTGKVSIMSLKPA